MIIWFPAITSIAGVEVVGVWGLLGASNRFSEDEALCAAGIPNKIEDFRGIMHNKFLVIDAEGTAPPVVTGSMNWSTSGDERNDENTLIMHDGGTAMVYAAGFWELYDALGEESDKPFFDVARELGVHPNTLYKWRRR